MDVTVRPPKRRKTRRDVPLTEGDPEAAEAVTKEDVEVSTRKGRAIKPVFVPLNEQGESGFEKTQATHTNPAEYVWDQDHGGVDTGDDVPADSAKTNMVSWVIKSVTLIFYLRRAATILSAGICAES